MLNKVRKELTAARTKAAEDHKIAQNSWQTAKAAKVKMRLARKLVKFTKKAANKAETRAEESLNHFDKIQAQLEKLEKRARKELRKKQPSANKKPANRRKAKPAPKPKARRKVRAKAPVKAHKPRVTKPAPRKVRKPVAKPVVTPSEPHTPEPVTEPTTPTMEAASPDTSNSEPANN